jgi:hypothetical protein
MSNQEDKELFAEIIKRAESGEHTKFEYIKSWREYKTRILNYKATEMLIKGRERSTKSLLKRYCKAVGLGQGDITTLLVRKALLDTKRFYDKELTVIADMISEYDAYLLDGNFISQFFFYETRPISECWDRRNMDNGF